MQIKKLIIFDLDGTILHTLPDMTNSMNYLFNSLNAPLITEKDMLEAMNKGRRYIIETTLQKKLNDEDNKRYQQIYHDHYFINKNILTKPYEGIIDLIKTLKKEGYLLAVCSNKLHNQTLGLVEEIFPNTFDYVLGSSDKFLRKPNNDMIIHIINELAVAKDNIVYIGDTAADMKAATQTGLYKIGVLYGYGNKKALLEQHPDSVVNHANEIYNIISNKFKKL